MSEEVNQNETKQNTPPGPVVPVVGSAGPQGVSPVSSKKPKSSKKKSKTQVTSQQTLRKEQGKVELLRLVESGASIPHAKDQLRRAKGYKTVSAINKWLEEDKVLLEKLLAAESAAVGDAEVGMLRAATGGTPTQKVEKIEYFADGVTVRKREISESFNPPNPSAGKFEITRRQNRLRRIAKGKEKPTDVPNPVVVLEGPDGEDIPLPQVVVMLTESIKKAVEDD
jgi:hypothetical protein